MDPVHSSLLSDSHILLPHPQSFPDWQMDLLHLSPLLPGVFICTSAHPKSLGSLEAYLGLHPSRSQVALLHAESDVFSGLPQHLVSFEAHHWLFTSYLLHTRLETLSEQVTCGGQVPGCRTRQFSTCRRKLPPSAPGPFPLLAACILLSVDPQVPSTWEAPGCIHLVLG